MMSGVPLETCWAFKKLWNNKFYYKAASCWYLYWMVSWSFRLFIWSGIFVDSHGEAALRICFSKCQEISLVSGWTKVIQEVTLPSPVLIIYKVIDLRLWRTLRHSPLLQTNQQEIPVLTLEAPVVLHYLKAPVAVKLTGVCFIAF